MISSLFEEEGSCLLFFKLEAFFKCPFTFKRLAQKVDLMPVWAEGLVEWWTSQGVVRSYQMGLVVSRPVASVLGAPVTRETPLYRTTLSV